MRWTPWVILAYLLLVFQTTLGGMLAFTVRSFGTVAPDLLAVAAVFVALRGPNLAEVMISAWILGLGLDLTAAGGLAATTVLGPMALSYALAAGVIFKLRDVVFSEQIGTQALLAWIFCLIAHPLWVLFQMLLAWSWSELSSLMLQALALSVYTGLLMPIGFRLLNRIQGLIIEQPVRRSRRLRRSARRP